MFEFHRCFIGFFLTMQSLLLLLRSRSVENILLQHSAQDNLVSWNNLVWVLNVVKYLLYRCSSTCLYPCLKSTLEKTSDPFRRATMSSNVGATCHWRTFALFTDRKSITRRIYEKIWIPHDMLRSRFQVHNKLYIIYF